MTHHRPRPAPRPAASAIKRKELHFFPGPRQLIWVVNGRVEARAEAWGGEAPIAGFHYNIMPPRRTTPGKYVVHSYAPYRTRTWPASRIPWGARIKVQVDKDGIEKAFYETGSMAQPWKPVEGFSIFDILAMNSAYYGERRIPERWVFNDFGPMAVRYFKDPNRNHRLDKGESLSGEMIHTTPIDEANTARSLPVNLQSSHGCIHVKPLDRDRFHGAGAFTPGTDFIIHGYDESVPREYL